MQPRNGTASPTGWAAPRFVMARLGPLLRGPPKPAEEVLSCLRPHGRRGDR